MTRGPRSTWTLDDTDLIKRGLFFSVVLKKKTNSVRLDLKSVNVGS